MCEVGPQVPGPVYLVEQGGNRLWQVVKRDYLFCRIHCFLVLSETMASYFVATEKETRSPL